MRMEKGKPQHCTETATGRGLTGTIPIGDDDLRAEIFAYDEFFHINDDGPVHLIAESAEVVSLHDVISGGPGRTYGSATAVYSQSLIANVALVGANPWTETDRVKRVTFSVDHTMELVRNKEKFEGLGKTRYPGTEHLQLFRDKVEGMTLSAGYGGTWGMDFDTPKDLWPIYEIEFDEPQDIRHYVRHVYHFVQFLSLSLGVKLKPRDIKVDRLSLDEIMRAVDEKTYNSPHEVHYVWPEAEIESRDLWVGASPVRAYDEEELSAFRACLRAWMDRSAEWHSSYVMMMSSYDLNRQVSAERLINACRWFEELPNAGSKESLAELQVEAIASAAASKAAELGLDPALRERIAGSIKRIKEETAAERFTRLIVMIEEKFGKAVLPENALTHLRNAVSLRGRTAHGHFYPEDESEYRAFAKSIHAMEALCCLLTAHGLPILEAGLKRMHANPPVRDYRHAYE